jgi:hypothetical protein
MLLGYIVKYFRFIYDMMAQTIIVICILNIFFGTIVDTFSGYLLIINILFGIDILTNYLILVFVFHSISSFYFNFRKFYNYI